MRRKILFVCEGNVGRSQIAEAYYNNLVQKNSAISAGINDVASKYNYRPTKEIIDTMLEEEIDISNQRIKHVTQPLVSKSERVIILCDRKLCPPFLKKHKNVSYIIIEDPDKLTGKRLRRIRNQIKKLVLSLSG